MKKKTVTTFCGFDENEKHDIKENARKIISHIAVDLCWWNLQNVSNTSLIEEFIGNHDNYCLFDMLKKYVPAFANLTKDDISEIADDDEAMTDFVDELAGVLPYIDYIPNLDDFKRVYLEFGDNDEDGYEDALNNYFENETTTENLKDYLKDKDLLDDFFKWYNDN